MPSPRNYRSESEAAGSAGRALIREGRALGGDEVTYILHLGQAELRFPGVGCYVVNFPLL